MGSIISTAIQYGFYTVFTSFGALAFLLYSTKPTLDSFKTYISGSKLGFLKTQIMNMTSNFENKDFIFYRVVSTTFTGSSESVSGSEQNHFLGIFNGWYKINPSTDFQKVLTGISVHK